jgi:hypothetical protein
MSDESTDSWLNEVLLPQQRQRLQQIVLQMRQKGPDGFRDSEIVQALQLTLKQQKAIRVLQEEVIQSMWGGSPDPQQHRHERIALLHKQTLEVLNPDQLKRWRAMTGEPFAGSIFPMGPPGGIEPPPGPPPNKQPWPK